MLKSWSHKFHRRRMVKQTDQGDGGVDSDCQIIALQALVEVVQRTPQVVVVRELEVGEFTVDPACASLHKAVLTRQLW